MQICEDYGMMKLSAGPAFPEGLVCAVLVIELLLTGCAGTPIRSEKETRAQAYSVAAGYRPGDQKPSLPVLTTDSSLGDYLTYAMLNQPRVEAAYYDWTGFRRAHHHGAVVARPAVRPSRWTSRTSSPRSCPG